MCKLIRGFDIRIDLGSILLECGGSTSGAVSRQERDLLHDESELIPASKRDGSINTSLRHYRTPIFAIRCGSLQSILSQRMVVDIIYHPRSSTTRKERIDAQSAPHDTDRTRLSVLGLRTLATELSDRKSVV